MAIIGLGLMGGSLGLALKRQRYAPVVCGFARRAATRKLALKTGAVDQVFTTPQEAVRSADIVVICTPVLSIAALSKKCAPFLPPDAIVTDVGSTKQRLVSQMSSLHIPFIGSHPIAGSEQSGLEAARANLYDGTVVIVTPSAGADCRLTERISALWQSAGAKTIIMQPDEHDSLIAATSHLPHLLAALLVKHVAEFNSNRTASLCGSGFRDTTRIASGSPEMWHDILMTNASAITVELKRFRNMLNTCLKMIETQDFARLRKLLMKSQQQRRDIVAARP